jgi:hypothetical protein
MGKTAEAIQKARISLDHNNLEHEAQRLIDLYISTFRNAPEADYLLKRAYFGHSFHKDYLQDNVFFIPRADYLWFFTYELGRKIFEGEGVGDKTIELKKRSASIDETEIEIVTIQIRHHYTVEQGVADIIHTRRFDDRKGEEFIIKNSREAVALAEKLLADFTNDQVTGYGNY